MNTYEKLICIQKKLKAPKTQYNAFGKYNYRNCEDILEAVKPLLDEVCFYITDEIVQIGERYYVKATVKFDEINVTAYAREEHDKKGMDASQITGAASSYARKYALNGLFLIDDTKDADSGDNLKEPPPKKTISQKESVGSDKSLEFLAPESPLKKVIEASIVEAKINRTLFKEFLFNKNKIALVEKDGKQEPSFSTMLTSDAQKMIDNWGKTVAAFQEWRKKGESNG